METTALFAYFSAILAIAVAISALARGERSVPHWSFALGMGVFAVASLCQGLAADALAPGAVVNWNTLALLALALLPAPWLLFALTYSRDRSVAALSGVPLLRAGVLAALVGAPVLVTLFSLRRLFVSVSAAEPWSLKLAPAGLTVQVLFLIAAVLVFLNLERTYRAAVGTMRWRIKYLVIGVAVLFAGRAYTCTQAVLFRSVGPAFEIVNSASLILGCALLVRGMLREGNFEVRVYPSHSVLHGSLTIIFAGVYLLVVGVGAKVISVFGGASAGELKAFLVLVALVLLGIALLSDRFKFFTRRLVSRHFQRPMYDYAAIWRRFAEGTARCVEPTEAAGAILTLASDIFQALSVSIWLLEDKRVFACAASTTSVNVAPGELRLSPEESAAVGAALRDRRDPVDLETCAENWTLGLKRVHPDFFRKGGHRVCVPMMAGGELLGLLLLGDRVSGYQFGVQDFELLKAISDQAAATLLNIRLSHQLSQAKQLEAFQAMSAFFVHDLKNTASILSLMLQNLPVHYDDPGFREDALRGISKTVTHLNDLISRLTLLRHELSVKPEPCDLNALIGDVLEHQVKIAGVELVRQFAPLPKINIDPG